MQMMKTICTAPSCRRNNRKNYKLKCRFPYLGGTYRRKNYNEIEIQVSGAKDKIIFGGIRRVDFPFTNSKQRIIIL
jgi:hypothetical protein